MSFDKFGVWLIAFWLIFSIGGMPFVALAVINYSPKIPELNFFSEVSIIDQLGLSFLDLVPALAFCVLLLVTGLYLLFRKGGLC